jgi:hypothetical protein
MAIDRNGIHPQCEKKDLVYYLVLFMAIQQNASIASMLPLINLLT